MPPPARRASWLSIAYSEDSRSQQSRGLVAAAPVSDVSYAEGPAKGLEGSRPSLGKRLASVAFEGPKDFEFLFHDLAAAEAEAHEPPPSARRRGDGLPATPEKAGAAPAARRRRLAAEARAAAAGAGAPLAEGAAGDCGSEPPERVEDEDLVWVRTPIRRASDLIDGQAWMQEFHRRREAAGPTASRAVENRLLREMAKACPPGRKLRLQTGQDVIFWFNVGAPGPLQKRVYVTAAKCPHKGACLLSAELREIEDVAGIANAMVRCPWHNKTFSLSSGHSPGNVEVLQRYPTRFMHGFWYVGVDLAAVDSSLTPAAGTSPRGGHRGSGCSGCSVAASAVETAAAASGGGGAGGGLAGQAYDSDPVRKKLRHVLGSLAAGEAASGVAGGGTEAK